MRLLLNRNEMSEIAGLRMSSSSIMMLEWLEWLERLESGR
jgi:hypothetical protein